MRKAIKKYREWYWRARVRAQRRRSPWNFVLLPVGFISVTTIWYGLFRVVWALHLQWHPQHELRDFWGSGLSLSTFVPSFLMVFALAPAALCAGCAAANCVAWLIRPAR